MKHLLLPEQLGGQIVNYLANRPYREVAELIKALQQLTYHEPQKDTHDETPSE